MVWRPKTMNEVVNSVAYMTPRLTSHFPEARSGSPWQPLPKAAPRLRVTWAYELFETET